jgi:MerR family mercuric resistance operon transcriptional regulator
MLDGLKIGQVAKLAGISVETVRFYERQGLLENPPRKKSGYRQYPQEAVSRICFIKKAKEVGFSLKEIKELFLLRLDSTATCENVRSRAEAKICDIEQKIQALQKMKQALADLTAACSGDAPIRECPILQALEQNEKK